MKYFASGSRPETLTLMTGNILLRNEGERKRDRERESERVVTREQTNNMQEAEGGGIFLNIINEEKKGEQHVISLIQSLICQQCQFPDQKISCALAAKQNPRRRNFHRLRLESHIHVFITEAKCLLGKPWSIGQQEIKGN